MNCRNRPDRQKIENVWVAAPVPARAARAEGATRVSAPVRVVNPNKIRYQLVKISDLARKFSQSGDINPEILKEAGLIKSTDKPVKILGGGSLEVGLTVYAQAFTRSAEEMISKAGGKVERI